MLGPLATGRVADRIGFASALRCAFALQAGAVALLVFSASPLSLSISSIIVGAIVPGIVTLVLGRVHELIPHNADQQKNPGACARPPSRWGKRLPPTASFTSFFTSLPTPGTPIACCSPWAPRHSRLPLLRRISNEPYGCQRSRRQADSPPRYRVSRAPKCQDIKGKALG
jgi:hypothetical protein